MPGSNAGTGYPLTLRCAKCRLGRYEIRGMRFGNDGTNLVATGRTRPLKPGRRGYRCTNRFIEYRCRDCNHVGWTRHIDAEMLLCTRRRSPLLTEGMEKVLRAMRDEGEELVCENQQAYVGLTRTSRNVEHDLLGLCLLTDTSDHPDSSVRHYALNEDGQKILDDPDYVPRILRTREGRLGTIMWIRTRSVLGAIQSLPPILEEKK